MEVIRLDETNLDSSAARAAAVLRAGGVVLYPTDTFYGLGADALSDKAVAKVKNIKRRDEGKPIHAIVSDLGMAARYAELTDDARLLAERLPQGQVTFIVSAKGGSASGGKKKVSTGIMRGIRTFGFRIPDNDFCLALVREFSRPVTATSANLSGRSPERSVEKILAQFGTAAESLDLVIDAGELPAKQPSTVVDLSEATPVIIREGAISAADVWNAIRVGA